MVLGFILMSRTVAVAPCRLMCLRIGNNLLNTGVINTDDIPPLTFENILSDENKLRAQKKLLSCDPVRTTKDLPLKPNFSYAAVLVPLCTFHGQPSLLFTLRSSQLRQHRGQVSFPGGNYEKSDGDFIQTALRETSEELGLESASFDVWGQLNQFPGSDGKKLVYPVLARTGEINIGQLNFSREEVEEVFCVPIQHLCDHKNIRFTRFCHGPGYTLPVYLGAHHRVWGLTAAIVHQVLNIIAPGLYTFKIRHIKRIHGQVKS